MVSSATSSSEVSTVPINQTNDDAHLYFHLQYELAVRYKKNKSNICFIFKVKDCPHILVYTAEQS